MIQKICILKTEVFCVLSKTLMIISSSAWFFCGKNPQRAWHKIWVQNCLITLEEEEEDLSSKATDLYTDSLYAWNTKNQKCLFHIIIRGCLESFLDLPHLRSYFYSWLNGGRVSPYQCLLFSFTAYEKLILVRVSNSDRNKVWKTFTTAKAT